MLLPYHLPLVSLHIYSLILSFPWVNYALYSGGAIPSVTLIMGANLLNGNLASDYKQQYACMSTSMHDA